MVFSFNNKINSISVNYEKIILSDNIQKRIQGNDGILGTNLDLFEYFIPNDMSNMFRNTNWITNAYSDSSDRVINMYNTYNNCCNLITSICGNNVTNLSEAYYGCVGLKTATCGKNVINANAAYYNCYNLTTAACGDNVVDLSYAYYNCYNLTTAACGDNVVNFRCAYSNCYNLTTATCGDNVVNFRCAYSNCYNLTIPICGNNVTDFYYTYYNCCNLTTAVCGNNVKYFDYTYYNCKNITTAICGNNVTQMNYTYYNCPNIQGNFDLSYSTITSKPNAYCCLQGRNSENMLNIIVFPGSYWDSFLKNGSTNYISSMTGSIITWTNLENFQGYYNEASNLYVKYPENIQYIEKNESTCTENGHYNIYYLDYDKYYETNFKKLGHDIDPDTSKCKRCGKDIVYKVTILEQDTYTFDEDSTNNTFISNNKYKNSTTARIKLKSEGFSKIEWTVSSQYGDKLKIIVDGDIIIAGQGGTTSGQFAISNADCIVEAFYIKDRSGYSGADQATIKFIV